MDNQTDKKLTPCQNENGEWGFEDEQGNVVIPCQYDEVGEFSEGLAWVSDGYWYGYINKKGDLVIPMEYTFAFDFEKGHAIVEDESRNSWFVIDKENNITSKGDYRDISIDFIGNSTVGTLRSGKQILLNRKGRPISNVFDSITETEDGEHWLIEEGEESGIIDTEGNVLIWPGTFIIEYPYFSDGLLIVYKNGLYGFVNENGETTIPIIYDNAESFREGFAAVDYNGKSGYINTKGDSVGEIKYDDVYSFKEGRGIVKLNEKWGFLDKNGNEIIPLIYDEAYKFYEGLAGVRKGSKWGYIDLFGNPVTPFKYDIVWDFKEGKARVKENNRHYFIDKTGNEIING